jgi:hypothetical protein
VRAVCDAGISGGSLRPPYGAIVLRWFLAIVPEHFPLSSLPLGLLALLGLKFRGARCDGSRIERPVDLIGVLDEGVEP